jgi:hypothetical protein
MKDLIITLLNDNFYYSTIDNCIYCIDCDEKSIGYSELHRFIQKAFNLEDDDSSYALTFNWLLNVGAPLLRKNWNKRFIAHNISISSFYEPSLTEDIDFKYVTANE